MNPTADNLLERSMWIPKRMSEIQNLKREWNRTSGIIGNNNYKCNIRVEYNPPTNMIAYN